MVVYMNYPNEPWRVFQLQAEEQRQLRRDANFSGFGLLALFVLSQITFSLIILLVRMFVPLDLSDPYLGLGNTAFLMLYMVAYSAMMGLPMILVNAISRRDIHSFRAHAPVRPVIFILTVCSAMALCVLANFVANIWMNFFAQLGFTPPEMPEYQENTWLSLGLNLLIFAVLPALLEEMVFRGYVLQSLRSYGDPIAVVMSALLFGLMHGNLLQLPFAFLLGLVFGYVVVQTGNIWIAVTVHFLNNAMSVLLQQAAFYLPMAEQQNQLAWAVFLAICVIGLLAAITLFAVRSRVTQRPLSCPSLLSSSKRIGTLLSSPALLVSIVLYLLYTLFTGIAL